MRAPMIFVLALIGSLCICQGNAQGPGSPSSEFHRAELKVAAVEWPPFVMKKDIASEEAEGFSIDILNLVCKKAKITCKVYFVEDNLHGSLNYSTMKWNGVIGEIIDGKAEIAIGDVSNNPESSEVVDFTTPIMQHGIGILIAKPPLENSFELFTFLTPFDWSVWLLIVVCYLLMGFVVLALTKITGQNVSQNGQKVTLLRSLFFRQLPMSGFAQMLAVATWYIFLVFVACAYINHLPRMFRMRPTQEVTSLEDLERQEDIQFGALRIGTTHEFLRDSNLRIIHSVFHNIASNPDGFVTTIRAGVEKVKAFPGKYAFLVESGSMNYILERECDLMQVGGYHKGTKYAMALRKNSSHVSSFNETIKKLTEDGTVQELIYKWWKPRGGGQCEKDEPEQEMEPLNLDYMGGIFILLLIGVILSFIAAVVEKKLTGTKNNRQNSRLTDIRNEPGPNASV